METAVLPAVQAHGLTLVDLEVRGNGRRMAVRLYVDKPGGVTIGDCQQLSHEVGDLIDVSNLVPEQLRPGGVLPGARPRAAQGSGAPAGPPGGSCGSGRGSRWTATASSRAGSSWWTQEALTLDTPDGPRSVPRSLVTKARLEVEPRGSA